MTGYNPELEQSVLSAVDETMRATITLMTFGFGTPPEIGRSSVAPVIEVVPVSEVSLDNLRAFHNQDAAPRIGGLTLNEVYGGLNRSPVYN